MANSDSMLPDFFVDYGDQQRSNFSIQGNTVDIGDTGIQVRFTDQAITIFNETTDTVLRGFSDPRLQYMQVSEDVDHIDDLQLNDTGPIDGAEELLRFGEDVNSGAEDPQNTTLVFQTEDGGFVEIAMGVEMGANGSPQVTEAEIFKYDAAGVYESGMQVSGFTGNELQTVMQTYSAGKAALLDAANNDGTTIFINPQSDAPLDKRASVFDPETSTFSYVTPGESLDHRSTEMNWGGYSTDVLQNVADSEGSDYAGGDSITTGDITATGDDGNDNVTVSVNQGGPAADSNNTITAGDTSADGGSGDDTVAINLSQGTSTAEAPSDDSEVSTGGNNTITVGDVTADGDSGDDTVAITFDQIGGAVVSDQSGGNEEQVDNSSANNSMEIGNVAVSGGDGNDEINIEFNQGGGAVASESGAGSNSLTAGDIFISGGPGDDTINLSFNSGGIGVDPSDNTISIGSDTSSAFDFQQLFAGIGSVSQGVSDLMGEVSSGANAEEVAQSAASVFSGIGSLSAFGSQIANQMAALNMSGRFSSSNSETSAGSQVTSNSDGNLFSIAANDDIGDITINIQGGRPVFNVG